MDHDSKIVVTFEFGIGWDGKLGVTLQLILLHFLAFKNTQMEVLRYFLVMPQDSGGKIR